MKCHAMTAKGKPCPINGEAERNGWCHVHDPNGENQVNIRNRRKAKIEAGGRGSEKNLKVLARQQQLRESIALEIESLCDMYMNNLCKCNYHISANIARYGLN